jgi:iron complex outermembrane receptor protein
MRLLLRVIDQKCEVYSAVPIDKLYAEDLKSSGQVTFDKMLAYKIPSFNSSSQAISDATAHFDPADLRGLGPSRTLVLVNGKEKSKCFSVHKRYPR